MTDSPVIARLDRAGCVFGTHEAVRGVDLIIRAGERVAILGASGAGKSTLLSLFGGATAATSGTVEIFGEDLARITAKRLRRLQRRIGSVSQRLDLIEQVRVLHNVNAGRLGEWSTPRALAAFAWPRPDERVRQALSMVDLDWAMHERMERLSGGERQRVAIARLLAQRPDLVLADEPVSSLDPARAAETLGLLDAAARDGALIVSLHQPDLARRHCTRAIGLREGAVVFDLAAAQVTDAVLDELYQIA